MAWLLLGLVALVFCGVAFASVGEGIVFGALMVLALVVAVGSMWLTSRRLARGRTSEQMIQWWFDLPVLGPVLRLGDRMGHTTERLQADRDRRGQPPPGP